MPNPRAPFRTDSATCLRRSHQGSKFCQALGGYNVGAAYNDIDITLTPLATPLHQRRPHRAASRGLHYAAGCFVLIGVRSALLGPNWDFRLAPITQAKHTTVIAAQMDGLALFHDNSWGGAASAVRQLRHCFVPFLPCFSTPHAV